MLGSSIIAAIFLSTAITNAYPIDKPSDRFLVVFNKGVSAEDIGFHVDLLARHVPFASNDADDYMEWFSFEEKGQDVIGYAASVPYEVLDSLISDPAVEYIEEDKTYYALETKVQHDATWGIVRASHRKNNGKDTDYVYNENPDNDVAVYVIDTGIFTKHSDFEKRARWGTTIPRASYDQDTLAESTDDNGHGTHCAGTIAGKTYGMCKSCKLVAVKVLDGNGSGSLSGVIAGVDWAIQDHKSRTKKSKSARSVANMSLGGGYSRTLNRAVDAAVEAGIHFSVAAGNSRDNSCDYSPASAENVITVGTSDDGDNMAQFSNYGECNDVFAPGVGITSTWINGKQSSAVLSGTSMASPHVAGAIGSLLTRDEYKDYTPAEMRDLIVSLSTKDAVKNVPSDIATDNNLLFTDPDHDSEDDDNDDDDTEDDIYIEELEEEIEAYMRYRTWLISKLY